MSYQFYKILHFGGLALVLISLGVRLFAEDEKAGKKAGLFHGIGLLVMLVAGFGLLAKTGAQFLSGWVISKFVLWLVLGASLTLARKRVAPYALWVGLVVLTMLAAGLALYKPF